MQLKYTFAMTEGHSFAPPNAANFDLTSMGASLGSTSLLALRLSTTAYHVAAAHRKRRSFLFSKSVPINADQCPDSAVTETEDKLSASVKKLQGKKKDLTEAEFKLNY